MSELHFTEEQRGEIVNQWGWVIEQINAVINADDAVRLHNLWEQGRTDDPDFPDICNVLGLLWAMELVSEKQTVDVALLLNYASSQGVINLDCSGLLTEADDSDR